MPGSYQKASQQLARSPQLADDEIHTLIRKQALWNLAWEDKVLSAEDQNVLDAECQRITHCRSTGFPSLISVSKPQGNSEVTPVDPHFAEDKNANMSDSDEFDSLYNGHAQNLLRHLLRGVPICDIDGQSHTESQLAQGPILQGLLTKKAPEFLKALREEMQNIFDHAFIQILNVSNPNPHHIKQYQIFAKLFLSIYPFLEPADGEELRIPWQAPSDPENWQQVTYQCKRKDISPTSGPLSWVLEEQDRLYAYVLEPKPKLTADSKEATQPPAHLIFMGTPHPTAQGADLAVLGNFAFRRSVGEWHDMTKVNEWLENQADKGVIVSGHSKGGVMAMMYAAQHPIKIEEANCLDPTGLCLPTLDRLCRKWNETRDKPAVNVYSTKDDPAFPLESGFLAGTNIYRIVPLTKKSAFNCRWLPEWLGRAYEAHIHHLASRSNLLVLQSDTLRENKRAKRILLDEIKSKINYLRFPVMYIELLIKIIARKIERFFDNYSKLIRGSLIVLGLIACALLAWLGVMNPGLVMILAFVGCIVSPLLLKMSNHLLEFLGGVTTKILSVCAYIVGIIAGVLYTPLRFIFYNNDERFGTNYAPIAPAVDILPETRDVVDDDAIIGNAVQSVETGGEDARALLTAATIRLDDAPAPGITPTVNGVGAAVS